MARETVCERFDHNAATVTYRLRRRTRGVVELVVNATVVAGLAAKGTAQKRRGRKPASD